MDNRYFTVQELHALDLYLKGVISLHEFKLIIAANKN